jgi:hypothetical protein
MRQQAMRLLGWLLARVHRVAILVATVVVVVVNLAVYAGTFYGLYWISEFLFGAWWPVGWLLVIMPLSFVGIMAIIFFGKQALSRD